MLPVRTAFGALVILLSSIGELKNGFNIVIDLFLIEFRIEFIR